VALMTSHPAYAAMRMQMAAVTYLAILFILLSF
jgi:hypothetical protein